jgi:hypothetical protein
MGTTVDLALISRAYTDARGLTSHAANAGNKMIAPSMFTRNMNVSMTPMSA